MADEAPSLADASAAMAASFEANDAAEQAPATPVETQAAPQAQENPATPVAEAPIANPLDGIDLSVLDPDVAKRIQDGFLRQQDYTRKTQEIAPYRKFLEESGADLDSVRESYEFVHKLQNDPEFLAKVAQELQEYAPQQTPVPNAQEQLPQIETPQGADPNLVRQIEDLNAWRASQEQERINAQLVAEWETKIQTAENAIRESNPNYTDEDISDIYELAPGVEYDMFKAQEKFERFRNRFVNEMVNPKLNHPNAANPVAGGTGATQPTEIRSFEEAAAATRERVRASGA